MTIQQQQQQQQNPSIRTTVRTLLPQQHHDATHQATHLEAEHYTAKIERNHTATTQTTKELPITEYNTKKYNPKRSNSNPEHV